ncbi:MAG: hypothetical protein K8R45_02485 [Desulfobacterales bacterium]|nr:hypothetical protein [Desulfobacterales bacterium]
MMISCDESLSTFTSEYHFIADTFYLSKYSQRGPEWPRLYILERILAVFSPPAPKTQLGRPSALASTRRSISLMLISSDS